MSEKILELLIQISILEDEVEVLLKEQQNQSLQIAQILKMRTDYLG